MPVFVASTFRDMDYERDVLARVVLPAVNERIKERRGGVSLYLVDLRWGVETNERHDLATRQRLILETCVNEVRRCRPLFIGLLGGKYGWIPPKELQDAAVKTANLADPGFPLSVTALEIVAAAQAEDGVPPILLSRQVPDGGTSPLPGGDQSERERHDQLRTYLVGLGHSYVFYPTQWRKGDQRYESAEFAPLATRALLAAVEDLVTGQDGADWLTAELQVQRWTAEREARQFVGRAGELQFFGDFWSKSRWLDEHDIGDDPDNPLWRLRQGKSENTVAVIGASGSGKSALLAKVATDVPIRTWVAVPFEPARAYVHVGATAASESLPVCLLLLLAQLDPAAAQSIASNHRPESLVLADVLDTWLTVLEGGMRLLGPLIVVDGLDRLHGSLTESQPMAWLPTSLGNRVGVVLSAADDSFEATLLARRPCTHLLSLGDLDRTDALTLVRDRVTAHHRVVPTAVVDILVRQAASPRWLVVATDLLLTLMAHDYLVLRRLTTTDEDAEHALHRLLWSVAAELPADIEGLHEETYHRLLELVDDRLGIVLGILGVSVFGLCEQDLQTLLENSDSSSSSVDFALFRDVLSSHVTVRRDEWRFAHQSAAEGVDRLLDAASEAVHEDARAGYRRGLVRHLLNRPVDDPVRSRELLVQLLFIEEDAILSEVLAYPGLASDESVGIFGVVLGTTATHSSADRFVHLITTAAQGRARLTVVQMVIAHVLPVLGRDKSAELVAHCRDTLTSTPQEARSRSGLGPQDLEDLLTAITAKPMSTQEPPAIVAWFDAVRGGVAGLRDLPDRAARQNDTYTRLAVIAELRAVIEYAVVAEAGLIPQRPDDPAVVHHLLDEARALADRIDDQLSGMRDYLRHLVAITERVGATTWPDAGFQPEDGDFDRVRALTDRTRGNADMVHLLGMCARAHAFQHLATISDDDEVTRADAAAIYTALEFLEEAIWQLDVQLVVTPDAIAIQTIAIQCGAQRTALLHACDQQASAARAGMATLSEPQAADVLGRENFIGLAGDTLFDWMDSTVNLNPGPLIDSVIQAMAEATDLPQAEVIEGMLLLTGLTAASRLGDVDLAIRMVERTFALVRSGVLDHDELPVDEIVDEAVARIEDDLLEVVEEGEELDEEDRAVLARGAIGVHALRSVLMRHRSGHPADLAGGAFAAALAANLGHPDYRDSAQRLRRLLTPHDQVARHQRLITAVDKLLTSPL